MDIGESMVISWKIGGFGDGWVFFYNMLIKEERRQIMDVEIGFSFSFG